MNLHTNISKLGLRTDIVEKLEEIKILEIEQLCKMTKSQLRKRDFSNETIEQIQIKLQLQGLDIRR